MQIEFIKMQAQGNDFIMMELLDNNPLKLNYASLARAICERRTGFGADGLVLIMPSDIAKARMVIYNSDGSHAAMCGSALRCVCYRLRNNTDSKQFNIETDSGLKEVELIGSNDNAEPSVNLGEARVIRQILQVDRFQGSLVDIGNQHFIIFKEDLDDNPHLLWGSFLEHHSSFQTGLNIHFVKVISPSHICMLIWERGVGATMACGTGAASAVAAGRSLGLLGNRVEVSMPGGTVLITCDPAGDYHLRGAVAMVGKGVFEWKV